MQHLAAQFGCPTGATGAVIARMMHLDHAPDYAAVLAEVPIRDGLRLLEIGMGAALHVPMLLDDGVLYHGIDHSPDMISAARRNASQGRYLCRDVCDGELPECDAAIAVNSVQWWRNPMAAFRALRHALVDGGKLVIGVAAPPAAGLLPDAGQRHYSGDELRMMLRDAGFARASSALLIAGRRPYLICAGVA